MNEEVGVWLGRTRVGISRVLSLQLAQEEFLGLSVLVIDRYPLMLLGRCGVLPGHAAKDSVYLDVCFLPDLLPYLTL